MVEVVNGSVVEVVNGSVVEVVNGSVICGWLMFSSEFPKVSVCSMFS